MKTLLFSALILFNAVASAKNVDLDATEARHYKFNVDSVYAQVLDPISPYPYVEVFAYATFTNTSCSPTPSELAVTTRYNPSAGWEITQQQKGCSQEFDPITLLIKVAEERIEGEMPTEVEVNGVRGPVR